MHSPEAQYLGLSSCEIPSVTGPKQLSSLSSPCLPPLTCAGCVLQAASLPEGGEGLAFGPGGGPGGQVGGHVPRLCDSAWRGWEKER